MNIRIIQLIRTLRLYGQSQYPRRITGTFTVELGDFLLSDVEVFEGHVNTFLPPPRLISFVDHSFNEPFVEALNSTESPRIRIQNVTDRFEFQLERVGIEIVGVSDERAGQSQYRGQVHPRVAPQDVLELWEIDSRDKRRFRVAAAADVLMRAVQCVSQNGEIDLIEVLPIREPDAERCRAESRTPTH